MSDYQPIIYKFLKKYQQDPQSKVFAPLAEAYRKAGLIEEAIQIAREGLRVHPNFAGGRVALARALFEQGKYQDVLGELASVMRDSPDNLVSTRLYAESALMLGKRDEALNAYKLLLFFVPQDGESAKIVQELELQSYENGARALVRDAVPTFSVKPTAAAIAEDPAQVQGRRIRKIEALQGLLQKIERYRLTRGVRTS